MIKQLQFPTGCRTAQHAGPTSVIHLDEQTRRIGRAGVADARAILAACAPTALGEGAEISDHHDPRRTAVETAPDEKQDRNLDEGPIDGAGVGLPATP